MPTEAKTSVICSTSQKWIRPHSKSLGLHIINSIVYQNTFLSGSSYLKQKIKCLRNKDAAETPGAHISFFLEFNLSYIRFYVQSVCTVTVYIKKSIKSV